MDLYQAWCYRKAQSEYRRKQKILLYFKLRLKRY